MTEETPDKKYREIGQIKVEIDGCDGEYKSAPLNVTSTSESGKEYKDVEEIVRATYLLANTDSIKAVKRAHSNGRVRVVIHGKLEISVQEEI